MFQALADRLQDVIAGGKVAVVGIVALDHDPRRIGGAGLAQYMP